MSAARSWWPHSVHVGRFSIETLVFTANTAMKAKLVYWLSGGCENKRLDWIAADMNGVRPSWTGGRHQGTPSHSRSGWWWWSTFCPVWLKVDKPPEPPSNLHRTIPKYRTTTINNHGTAWRVWANRYYIVVRFWYIIWFPRHLLKFPRYFTICAWNYYCPYYYLSLVTPSHVIFNDFLLYVLFPVSRQSVESSKDVNPVIHSVYTYMPGATCTSTLSSKYL